MMSDKKPQIKKADSKSTVEQKGYQIGNTQTGGGTNPPGPKPTNNPPAKPQEGTNPPSGDGNAK